MSEETEPELKFTSTIIAFQVAVDILKLADDDVRKAAEAISQERFAMAANEFYTDKDRAKGLGTIVVNPKLLGKVFNATDPLTTLPVERSLEFWRHVDYGIFDEPFFEKQNISRLRLLGFKSRLPSLEETSDVSVFLTLNKYGVAVISFWYHITAPLSPDQLAHLQLLPMLETPSITASLPIDLLEAAGKYNSKAGSIAKKAKEAGKSEVTFGQKNPLTFQSLTWFYWGPILNAIHGGRFTSQEQMMKELRSEAFICFPFIIAQELEPAYDQASEYYENMPKQIYQVVNQCLDYPADVVRIKAVKKQLGQNLSDREDVLYLSTLGSALIAFGTQTTVVSQNVVASELNAIRGRFTPQEGEDPVALEIARIALEAYDVTEIVLMQRLLLDIVEVFFSNKDIIDMKPQEMVRMHESLANQLEMVYGSKSFRETSALIRFQRAKKVMLVDEIAERLKSKLDNIENAQKSLHDLKSEIQQGVLGVILGAVPSILIFIGASNPTLTSILSVAISALGMLIANQFAYFYWKLIRRREKI
ncbi:MAG TPA: hypothetical protein VKK79_20210 [Candidatus Lokiarchaeia archaeon]|nr:hypothetical protein [Candidatus Lokiarchaeia archaeon]